MRLKIKDRVDEINALLPDDYTCSYVCSYKGVMHEGCIDIWQGLYYDECVRARIRSNTEYPAKKFIDQALKQFRRYEKGHI